jgi:hypothetical protein
MRPAPSRHEWVVSAGNYQVMVGSSSRDIAGRGGGAATMAVVAEHYQRPGWFTTNVFNRIVAALTRLGVSGYGSRVLEVRGRKSGEWRSNQVNLPPLLRAYLKKWKFEVGAFFAGVGPDGPDGELRRIAPDHPAFRLTLTKG